MESPFDGLWDLPDLLSDVGLVPDDGGEGLLGRLVGVEGFFEGFFVGVSTSVGRLVVGSIATMGAEVGGDPAPDGIFVSEEEAGQNSSRAGSNLSNMAQPKASPSFTTVTSSPHSSMAYVHMTRFLTISPVLSTSATSIKITPPGTVSN